MKKETGEFNKQEYNRLCAEFLGFTKTAEDEDFCFYRHHGIFLGLDYNNKPIHKTLIETNFASLFTEDWNCIMEIYNKVRHKDSIIRLPMNGVADSVAPYLNESGKITRHLIKGDKQAVVEAIWQFLNWYKENNKK